MRNHRLIDKMSAALALGLGLGLISPVFGQSGPGLSSGSGAGTGAGGIMGGVQRSGSSSISGVGPGPASTVYGATVAQPLGPRTGAVPFGPGVDVTFPDDPYLMPYLLPVTIDDNSLKTPALVSTDLIKGARMIEDPGQLSLALQRIANGAIASTQLLVAHRLIEESITATSKVTIPLVRDQRLIALVTSLNLLTEALLREGRADTAIGLDPAIKAIEALPKRLEGNVLLRFARLEWKRAVYLATLIGNPTYRNEMLYRVAESVSSGSATLANDYARAISGDVPDIRPPGAAPPPAPAAEKLKTSAKVADEMLVDSWAVAEKIERLIWKNRAMVRIALSAADSGQHKRGFQLAQTIENAESRTEAMLLLAESQCRPPHNDNDAATASYAAAGEAVAAIQQDGLRGVLAGFVVDSLISAGRFDDARASLVLYPEEAERYVALGAIAESQGRRGKADSARRWIASEVRPEYRSDLYRRVTSGILWSVEQSRSREFLKGDALPGR
jgi:hypothetical protein